jgi:hypothetical protein
MKHENLQPTITFEDEMFSTPPFIEESWMVSSKPTW